MNYLNLVRATLRESGIGGGDIDSVNRLIGYDVTIASFVRQAWLMIQEGQNWLYNRLSFECVLLEGQREYAPESMRTVARLPSIPRFDNSNVPATSVRKWILTARDGLSAWTLTDLGRNDPADELGSDGPIVYGGFIEPMEFDVFKRLYLTRPESTITRRKPIRFTIRDNEPKSVIVFPTPDVSDRYVVYGECQRSSQSLENDDDIPHGLPEEYHDMIKWQAIMLANGYDQDSEAYQFAAIQYGRLYKDATGDLTPKFRIGDSLAGSNRSNAAGRYLGSFTDI